MEPSIYIIGDPQPPFTTSSLTSNLICRVLFGLLANAACVVPLHLLARNGELAAVVFIANVIVTNSRNVLNSLIWHDDNVHAWWLGVGFCDLDAYVVRVNISLFATCLLAVMRNLAIQVGSLRANPLTQTERRRRNLVQALIMFPLPLLQLAFVYPLAMQRYWIGTLVGCTWSPSPSWPYVVFFVFPPMIIALATTVYAVLIYKRYRQVVKSTSSALSTNRTALLRTQRTKRRLYLMVISILIPFLPIVIALGVGNLLLMGNLAAFDVPQIHAIRNGHPWNSVYLRPSDHIMPTFMNNCYVPIMTAVPIFAFFGMTKDAINSYRKILLALRLGRVFPALKEEYDPDRSAAATDSSTGVSLATRSTDGPRSGSLSTKQLSSFTSTATATTSRHDPEHEDTNDLPPFQTHCDPTSQPPETDTDPVPPQPSIHSPFLFRTRLNLPPMSSLFASRSKDQGIAVEPQFPDTGDSGTQGQYYHVPRHPREI